MSPHQRERARESAPFGTTTSWLNLRPATIFSDSDSSRRTRHSSCRSASSRGAQDLGRAGGAAAPARRGPLPRRPPPARRRPRAAGSRAVPSGASERTLRYRATASSDSPSISSSAAGTTRSPDDVADGVDRGLDVGNVARSVAWTGGLRHQAQDDPRDDRQRAFGSDQQVRQVVADDVLDDLAAGLDDLAGRQHRLEPEHVLLGRAVLERARAAGALGDVAADDRLPQRRRDRADRTARPSRRRPADRR